MSRLPFELLLAVRYLRPKRTFVSIITLISIIGVMLGVAVLIVVISVMAGFDRQLRDRILGFSAHLRIELDRPMPNYEAVVATVSSNRAVRGVAPFVFGPVLAQTQGEDGSARQLTPVLRGVDPVREPSVSTLLTQIVAGTNQLRGKGLLVGRAFASKMKLSVGDRLAIYSVRDFEKIQKSLQRAREAGELTEGFLPSEFEIRGIFEVGYFEYDNAFVVMSLANAQDLFDLDDTVSGLLVMLDNPDDARRVRGELEQALGWDYTVSTWEEDNSVILDALLVEKNVMFYLLFFIMIVAAFGITSALITFVVQKTREIGILKALGASRWQIAGLFLSQSLIVGVLGVAAGWVLGLLAVHYRNEFLYGMRRVTGMELFPANIYQFTELPALMDRGDIALICGGSLFICLLAGLLPAWNAGSLKPVEALRHE